MMYHDRQSYMVFDESHNDHDQVYDDAYDNGDDKDEDNDDDDHDDEDEDNTNDEELAARCFMSLQ